MAAMNLQLGDYIHDALDRVEHTSTVTVYSHQFTIIKGLLEQVQPWLPESYLATRFVHGLQQEYQAFVLRFNPVTIFAAHRLATIYEESIGEYDERQEIVGFDSPDLDFNSPIISELGNFIHDNLDKIMHITSVETCYHQFETLKSFLAAAKPWLPESYFADRFVYCLQAEYQKFVLKFSPTTVTAAYRLAQIFEESLYLDYFPEVDLSSDKHYEELVREICPLPVQPIDGNQADQVEEEAVGALVMSSADLHKDTEFPNGITNKGILIMNANKLWGPEIVPIHCRVKCKFKCFAMIWSWMKMWNSLSLDTNAAPASCYMFSLHQAKALMHRDFFTYHWEPGPLSFPWKNDEMKQYIHKNIVDSTMMCNISTRKRVHKLFGGCLVIRWSPLVEYVVNCLKNLYTSSSELLLASSSPNQQGNLGMLYSQFSRALQTLVTLPSCHGSAIIAPFQCVFYGSVTPIQLVRVMTKEWVQQLTARNKRNKGNTSSLDGMVDPVFGIIKKGIVYMKMCCPWMQWYFSNELTSIACYTPIVQHLPYDRRVVVVPKGVNEFENAAHWLVLHAQPSVLVGQYFNNNPLALRGSTATQPNSRANLRGLVTKDCCNHYLMVLQSNVLCVVLKKASQFPLFELSFIKCKSLSCYHREFWVAGHGCVSTFIPERDGSVAMEVSLWVCISLTCVRVSKKWVLQIVHSVSSEQGDLSSFVLEPGGNTICNVLMPKFGEVTLRDIYSELQFGVLLVLHWYFVSYDTFNQFLCCYIPKVPAEYVVFRSNAVFSCSGYEAWYVAVAKKSFTSQTVVCCKDVQRKASGYGMESDVEMFAIITTAPLVNIFRKAVRMKSYELRRSRRSSWNVDKSLLQVNKPVSNILFWFTRLNHYPFKHSRFRLLEFLLHASLSGECFFEWCGRSPVKEQFRNAVIFFQKGWSCICLAFQREQWCTQIETHTMVTYLQQLIMHDLKIRVRRGCIVYIANGDCLTRDIQPDKVVSDVKILFLEEFFASQFIVVKAGDLLNENVRTRYISKPRTIWDLDFAFVFVSLCKCMGLQGHQISFVVQHIHKTNTNQLQNQFNKMAKPMVVGRTMLGWVHTFECFVKLVEDRGYTAAEQLFAEVHFTVYSRLARVPTSVTLKIAVAGHFDPSSSVAKRVFYHLIEDAGPVSNYVADTSQHFGEEMHLSPIIQGGVMSFTEYFCSAFAHCSPTTNLLRGSTTFVPMSFLEFRKEFLGWFFLPRSAIYWFCNNSGDTYDTSPLLLVSATGFCLISSIPEKQDVQRSHLEDYHVRQDTFAAPGCYSFSVVLALTSRAMVIRYCICFDPGILQS